MSVGERPPGRDERHSGSRTTGARIGLSLVVVVFCLAPVLVAAGALAAIGGVMGNPWVIAIAVFFLATAVTALVRRFRSGRGAGEDREV
ncbi:hypothetical protein [Streptomyces sp. NPDC048142]|uniref:hypothetical protein n=1 Tax=Streptomyces sp. NPDC048142 TaxID=3365501 RepID=UPI003712B2FD